MVRIVECYQATFAHPMTFSCMLWCLQAGGGQEGYQKHDWDLEAQQQEEEEEARRHHREVGACRCSLCRAVQPPKLAQGVTRAAATSRSHCKSQTLHLHPWSSP
eukprot:scaffold280637_cov15-Tisochrysis_lutea.AAC.1